MSESISQHIEVNQSQAETDRLKTLVSETIPDIDKAIAALTRPSNTEAPPTGNQELATRLSRLKENLDQPENKPGNTGNDMAIGVWFMLLIALIFFGAAGIHYYQGLLPGSTIATTVLIGFIPLSYVLERYWSKKHAFIVDIVALLGAAGVQFYAILSAAGTLS